MSLTSGQSTAPAASAGTSGFSFGSLGNPAGATGTSTAAASIPGFSFGTQATTTAASAGGTVPSGFSFGATQPASADQQQKSVRFDLPGSGAATSATSASLGTAPTLSSLLGGISTPGASTASTSLGGGFKFGSLTTTAALTTSSSFGLQPSAGLSFGLGANTSTATVAPNTANVGLLGTPAASMAATTAVQGLGGIASVSGSTTAGANKTSDAKAVKELTVPPEIVATVEEFTKHVKTQKGVRENIARMSSKPLYRVQDDIKNLRQQLLLVTSGLQRNAAAIDKLKKETAQELKHAEVAQRTKDTPPGLQYENTAPSEYFQRLSDEFEVQMQLYRQQIVELENHLESADRAATFTPQELSLLLGKLNESFIALAAQLQVVHEAVKEQKENYATYRRTVFGDTSDIFDRRLRTSDASSGRAVVSTTVPSTVGPTPFASMSNVAAVAMAAAMNRSQPTATPGFGMAVGGSTSLGTGTQSSALGGTLFGSAPAGTGLGSSLANKTVFGSATTTQSSFSGGGLSLGSLAAGSQPAGGGLFGQASSTPSGGLFGNAPTGFGSPQPFALSKTPIGSKRGKNA